MIAAQRLLCYCPVQLLKRQRCFLASSVLTDTNGSAVHIAWCPESLVNDLWRKGVGETKALAEKMNSMSMVNGFHIQQRRPFQTNAKQTLSESEESYEFRKEMRFPKRNTIWEKHYEELKKFHDENGHCNVSATDENRELYGWIHRQRKAYKNQEPRLAKHQIEKLKALDFSFDVQEDKWMESYKELLQYKANHGDCIVPLNNEPSMKGLSRWVDTQRQNYSRRSRGLKTPLTDERIAMLEKIEFAWNVLDVRWQLAFEELAEHVRINGNGVAPSPKSKLGNWLAKQKKLHRRLLGGETVSLTKERLEKLRSLGFL